MTYFLNGTEGGKKNHKCIFKEARIFKFSQILSYIFLCFLFEMQDKKPVCMINCHDERIRGSCLRDENNKGINYCRHHQGWNDTAMCTPFPWQLAMGRWMFHSHSAPRYTSINQTYIKSTRFLLWAERRAGLFSCYCIIMEKKHKTMRSFWAGNKLRNY